MHSAPCCYPIVVPTTLDKQLGLPFRGQYQPPVELMREPFCIGVIVLVFLHIILHQVLHRLVNRFLSMTLDMLHKFGERQ